MHNSIEQTNGEACIQRLRNLPTETMPPYNWQEFQRRSLRRSAAANDAMDWRPIAAAAAFLLFVCAIAIWGRLGGGGRHVVADSGAVEDGAATWKRDAMPLANYADGAWRPHGNGSGSPVGDAAIEKIVPRAGEPAGAATPHGEPHAMGPGEAATPGGEPRAMGPNADSASRALGSSVDGAPRARGPGETPTPYSGSRVSGDSTIAAIRSRALESWLATLPREPTVVRVGTRAAVAGLEDRIAQVDDLMTSMRIDGMQPDGVADLQRERLRLVGSLAQVRYAEVVASQSP